jgi:hypothetical protein
MDSIEDVFEAQGLIKKLSRHQRYSMKVDGHVRAWMKHQKVQTIITPEPAHNSDKEWLIKVFDTWEFYRENNPPLHESQQVDGMFADPPMTGPPAIASKLLDDSPAKLFNESTLYKLRDQPLLQVVPKMYDSSDENRKPQVQVAGAQIQKDIKVILHQTTSPPPPQSCVRTTPCT